MDENGFTNYGGEQGTPSNIPPQPPEYGMGAQPIAENQQGMPPNNQPPEPKHKKGGWKIAVSIIGGVVVGVLLMAFVVFPIAIGGQGLAELPVKQEQQGTGEKPELGGEAVDVQRPNEPTVEIAENISGSVVGITAYSKQLVSGQEPIEQALGAGTGFVISEQDGYVLTNNHVVAQGNLIKVTTPDGEEHVAEKVGGDSTTDIAVLKVENLGIKAVPLGDSDAVKAGELAVAIGNIHGETFNNSVTVGYVSIPKKEVALDGNKMDMIQTDAAINPGNSGGPLIGGDGKVIGVTSAKRFYSGIDEQGNLLNSEGVGYAIPINQAISIAEQLIQNGSIPRPGIGISYNLISDVDAKLWGTPLGILVVDVVEGGPAEQAGLQPNDVIIEFDGVDLTDGSDMPVLSEKAVGDTVSAKVWREGREYSVTMTLADLNASASTPTADQDQELLPLP